EQAGVAVAGLVERRHVSSDFSYSYEVYRDGSFLSHWQGEWNVVAGTWGYTYCLPQVWCDQPGTYSFKVYVDEGKGRQLVAELPFAVERMIPPTPTVALAPSFTPT